MFQSLKKMMLETFRPSSGTITRLILTVLLGLFGMDAFGDTLTDGKKAKNHVIIAVDNVVPHYKHVLLNKDFMLLKIDDILVRNGKNLLSPGDYVSVVTFGLGDKNYNYSRFVLPVTLNDRPLVWTEFTSFDEIFSDWGSQVLNKSGDRILGAPYSMLSGAKPFIMSYVNSNDPAKTAERTFILLITDDHYNGNDDFRKEFAKYHNNGGCAPAEPFEQCVNLYHSFYKDRELVRREIAFGYEDSYKLILLEIIPATIPSINGILDIPASLNVQRVPGGYEIIFQAKSVDDFYQFRNLKVTVTLLKGTPLVKEADSEGNVSLRIPYGAVDPNDIRVDLDGEVLQKDGMYDGMVISPLNPNTPRMHASRSISVTDDGKIFGMRMPDAMWWWSRGDIRQAAFIWEVIIVLLVIFLTVAAVGWYNKKSTVYTLGNDEIGIRAITSGNEVSHRNVNLAKRSKKKKE